MKKIPSLFERDHSTGQKGAPVTGRINPGTEWALVDEDVVARRQWDGTCVRLVLLADVPDATPLEHRSTVGALTRRMVRPGGRAPLGFIPEETDPNSGKTFGWEPAAASSYWPLIQEAELHEGTSDYFDMHITGKSGLLPGTYELVGPKIQANAERLREHRLERHDTATEMPRRLWGLNDVHLAAVREAGQIPLRLDHAAASIEICASTLGWEGVVFHHPDGRRAKLKASDVADYRELLEQAA